MPSLAAKAARQVNRIANHSPSTRKDRAIDQLVLSIYAQCHLMRLQENEIWIFYEDDSTLNIIPMTGRTPSPGRKRHPPLRSEAGDTHILGTPGDDRSYRQLRTMCHRLLNTDCDHSLPPEQKEPLTQ